jgi:HAD superfamily hydrolase (TIGR01549 family)
MARLALFDLDNTLLDRERAFERWASTFIELYGLSEGSWSIIELMDEDGLRPRSEFFEGLREALSIDIGVEDLLADYYDQYPRCFSVDRETVDAVRRLRDNGWKVGVVTNGPPSQMSKLEATDLLGEFDVICVSSIVGSRKPERGIFEEAARTCGVALEGWMVGDSPSADVAGGRAAGLATIWMSRGREWDHSQLPPPDFEVSTIAEAVVVILGAPVLSNSR